MPVKRIRKNANTEPPPPILFVEFAIQKALHDEYRLDAHGIPKRGNGRLFIVDGRGPGDFAANGELYSYFCSIHAEVRSNDEVEVTLSGNIPDSERVKNWQTKYKHMRNPFLTFTVKRSEQQILGELALAVASIVERGAPRYTVPSYKYVCPQTSYSLNRLKGVLDRSWADSKEASPEAQP